VTVPTAWQYTPGTASTILTTIVGATVALAGFVVTMTVLAIQMATGTFSARYMRIWYRDFLLKASLAALVGTLAFSFSLLRQVGATQVPNIGVSLAGFLLVVSLVLFLFFFDRFIHRLRPVAVADLGRQARHPGNHDGHHRDRATHGFHRACPGPSDGRDPEPTGRRHPGR
jgi:uncharacterized membrane protein